MTADELLFALAPDAKAVDAVRALDKERFTGLKRSEDGEWLSGSCRGYSIRVHLGKETARCSCDCMSMKHPCKHAIALAVRSLTRPGDFSPGNAFAAAVEDWPVVELPKAAAAPKDAGEALLQAVFDAPDDMAAPLIYADWLSEHGGDEDRAAFIRAQHRVATLPDGAEKKAAQAEEKELLKKHRAAWLEGFPPGLRSRARFQDGFVRAVQMTNTDLLRNEDIGRLHPLREVVFTGNFTRMSAAGLAVLDWWKRVRVVSLEKCVNMDSADLGLFFRNIHLTGLRELRLNGHELGARGLRILTDWPGLASVRRLELHDSDLSAGAAAKLCASPHLGGLTALLLDVNAMSAADAKALAACPKLAGLEELGLGGCPIRDAGAKAVLAGFPALKRVRLWAEGTRPPTRAALDERFGAGIEWK